MPAQRKGDDLHDLHSTKPHDRTPVTPSMLVAGRPRFPKSLSAEARRVFKLLVKQLEARRVLTEGDGFLLQLAAELWDRRARAQAKLLEEGEVKLYTRLDSNGDAHQVEKPNLWLKVAAESEKQLVAILDRLGLSPIAGSKVKQTRPPESEFEEMPEGSVGWMILQGEKAAAPPPAPVLPEEMEGDDE